jgi:hypothetical protein
MPTQPYKIGTERVPSVTTIINRFKNSGGLIHWANQQGLKGVTLDDARAEATMPGTIAHQWVHDQARSLPLTAFAKAKDEDVRRATVAFEAYLQWYEGNKIVIRYCEVALTSAKHRFGGTLDAIGVNHNGAHVLLDWKNANAVYPDHLYQLAGYDILWSENYPKVALNGGFHLCRFDKEHGDFSHHFYPSLEQEKTTFLTMRGLYDMVKLTEKRVR